MKKELKSGILSADKSADKSADGRLTVFLVNVIAVYFSKDQKKNINCTMYGAAFRAATQHNASCSDNK